MNPKLQAELSPAAVRPGTLTPTEECAASTAQEMDFGGLVARQDWDGDDAALAWELSKSYEERFCRTSFHLHGAGRVGDGSWQLLRSNRRN